MINFPANFGSIVQSVFGVLTGFGQIAQAKQETAMGEYNAQVYQQQAQAERESQRLSEFQKRKAIKSQISAQTAAAGASGFGYSGDPLTIMQSSLANAELDLAIDKYNSEVRARGYKSSADMAKYEARQRASRSYMEASGSFLKTAAYTYERQKLGGTSVPTGISTSKR